MARPPLNQNSQKKRFKKKRVEISVIIPSQNESKLISNIVKICKSITNSIEVIVVANGCSDNTVELAKKAGARVIEYKKAIGHDVGRAIGAFFAEGSILVFVDADIKFTPQHLRPFIQKIRS